MEPKISNYSNLSSLDNGSVLDITEYEVPINPAEYERHETNLTSFVSPLFNYSGDTEDRHSSQPKSTVQIFENSTFLDMALENETNLTEPIISTTAETIKAESMTTTASPTGDDAGATATPTTPPEHEDELHYGNTGITVILVSFFFQFFLWAMIKAIDIITTEIRKVKFQIMQIKLKALILKSNPNSSYSDLELRKMVKTLTQLTKLTTKHRRMSLYLSKSVSSEKNPNLMKYTSYRKSVVNRDSILNNVELGPLAQFPCL